MFNILKRIIVNWCLSKKTTTIDNLLNHIDLNPTWIGGPDGDRKFTASAYCEDLAVKTDIGYSKVKQILETVQYDTYKLTLEDNFVLECADDHLVIKPNYEQIQVKKLTSTDYVITKDGPKRVISVEKLQNKQTMYDLELSDKRHLFFTNGILSHNTQTISMFLLWYASFFRDQTILIASKNNNHAMEIMDRIRFAYEELPNWLKAGCKYYNKHNIEFDNGSRIKSEATTEKTGRGLAISKLYLDELAFINPRIQTNMWTSLAPTLSTGGSAIISSTPNGDTDLFAQLWRGANSGQNSFKPLFFPWNRHPERGEEYLKEMKGQLGNTQMRQEVLCDFLSSDALLIDTIKLSYIKAIEPTSSNMGFRFWTDKIGGRGKTYLVGVDPSTGNGNDFTSIQVVEFPSLVQVAELRTNILNIPLIYAKIKWLLKHLRQPDENRGRAEVIWSFERNGIGEALVALIQNDDSPDGGVYIDGVELYNEKPDRLGVYTTGKSKVLACMHLKNLVEKINGGLKINSDVLLFELQNFIASGGSYNAKQGATDDAIMAMCVVMKVLNRMASYDEAARKVVYEQVDPDTVINGDDYGDEPIPYAI
jgi:hypothetical protein